MLSKPKCFVPRGNYPNIFHGVPSFMGLPIAKNTDDLKNMDVTIMGVPWEGSVTWGKFSGCELATKSIRNASLRYGGFLPEYGYDLFDYLTVCDYGDTTIVPGDFEATQEHIYKKTSDILSAGSIPFTFGGDHSITVPIVNALISHTKGKVGIIHLDAHMDNMFSFGDEKNARCCPFYRLYENGQLDASKIVHMGIRGPRNNPDQVESARKYGATIINGLEIKTEGIDNAIRKALNIVKNDTDAVYVTVCSDVLDVAFNPGGPPDMNGLSSFELSKMLYEFASSGINGFDFVEIYPPMDPNGVSSHLAAWMSIYTLSGLAHFRKTD